MTKEEINERLDILYQDLSMAEDEIYNLKDEIEELESELRQAE